MTWRGVRSFAMAVAAALAVLVWLLCWWMVGRSWEGVRALSPIVVLLDGGLIVGAALIAPVAGRRRWPLVAAGTAIVVVLAGSWLWPALHQPQPAADALRVLTWNMQDHPDTVADLVKAVREWHPDLVMLEQTPKAQVAADPTLRAALPFQVVTAAQGAPTSVALLSRYPISDLQTIGPDTHVWPVPRALLAHVALPGGTALVVVAHPRWPLPEEGRGYGGWRDPQLTDVAAAVADQEKTGIRRIILAGDLNLTTREAAYPALLKATGLHDAVHRRSWTLSGTWKLLDVPVPGALPLDHVLHSSCLREAGTRTLWKVGGSDHIPVITALHDDC